MEQVALSLNSTLIPPSFHPHFTLISPPPSADIDVEIVTPVSAGRKWRPQPASSQERQENGAADRQTDRQTDDIIN